MNRLLTLLFAFSIGFSLRAQVVINELSAANFQGGGFIDNFGDYEDWLELYNTSGTPVDLSGFYLSDNELEPMKWAIPAGINIAGNGFLRFWCSGRDIQTLPNLHTNFKITQAKQEGAVLSNPGGIIVDSYLLLTANQRGHSRGRTTDGGNTWSIFTTPTPGNPNAAPRDEYPELTIATAPGYYSGNANVTITSATPGATIRYTTDGSEPIVSSQVYTGSINLAVTTVIRARAFSSNPDTPPSFIATHTYFLNQTHSTPIVSVSGNQLLTLLNGQQIEPVGHFELFSPQGELLAQALGDFNEHGNDSWAYPQRGIDYITQDEFGYGNEIEYPVFPGKDRDGYQRLILKAAASDNYPFENGGAHIRDAYVQSLSQVADLKLDERSYEPCVMYVNGQYWGVYEIREKVDDIDFTDHYYDQGSNDVDFLKTWGGTWEEFGSADEWYDLRDYILGNDMSVDANYEYVVDRFNVTSLIDYFTLNSYTVCADWLNWNTGWWRGRNPDGDGRRWRYILWDMDATFGHYVNFTGIPDQSANADICDPAQIGDPGGQGHVPIWNALLTNDQFFSEYVNRFSDLSGIYFSCDFMHNHLDSLVGLIAPEMPGHITRWGGSMAEWESNVQEIHDFIDTRCATVNDGFIDCYPELSGPYQITLMADPPEGGRIDLSSFEISTYPYTTAYFGGIEVPFDADENPGFSFSHWTSNNTVITPDELDEAILLTFTANDTLVAHFVPDQVYNITLNAEPALGGSITLNGVTYNSFPVTIELPATDYAILATANGGWAFDYWQSDFVFVNAPISAENLFSADADGSITAFFEELIYSVSFNVVPAGAGSMRMNESDITPLPANLQIPGGVDVLLETASLLPFHEFSHWSILNAIPAPNESSAEIITVFNTADVVIANYVELPNYLLQVEVEPEGAGVMRIDGIFEDTFPYEKRFLSNDFILLDPINRGIYEFSHWEVFFGYPIAYPEVGYQNYKFLGPARLIAHFKERIHNVYIPNSFTPNGDGVNDLFKAYANEIAVEDFRFAVIDRWGKTIWTTFDIDKGWNGNLDGGDYYCEAGVYAYFIRYTNTITGEIVERLGHITLIR